MAVNFSFEGRMNIRNLPDEAKRVANLLIRHGVTGAYGVRIRLVPLRGDTEVTFESEALKIDLEIIDVPPLKQSLSSEEPLADLFEGQRLKHRSCGPLSLLRHKEMLRGATGPDRGPADTVYFAPPTPTRPKDRKAT